MCKIYDGATIAKGGGVFMFKIYDGTKINKGGCLRCIMNRNNQKEGLCVRYVMNRKRQSPKEGGVLKRYDGATIARGLGAFKIYDRTEIAQREGMFQIYVNQNRQRACLRYR